jgi:hypothetical protein
MDQCFPKLTAMDTAETPGTREVARWFRRHGFAALLEGTSMRRRRAARLARAMAVLFIVAMVLVAPGLTSSTLVTVLVAVGVVLATWIGGNLAFGRPWSAMPDRVTWIDRTVFLVVPALVVLVAPHQNQSVGDVFLSAGEDRVLGALAMLAWQVLVLAVLTLLAYSGLIALWPWLWRRVVSSFLAGGTALGRILPVLLGVVGFLFFTAELWQTVGRLDSYAYLLAVTLFVLSGWLFLHSRGLELDRLARFDDADEVVALLSGTPLAGGEVQVPAVCPLTREQATNLQVITIVSKLTMALVVGLAFFVFFLVLGVLSVNAEVVQSWAQAPAQVIVEFSSTRRAYALTWEHVRVSGFLAVFSGFTFAVVSATDQTLREGLRDSAEDEVRQACAARLVALQRYPLPAASSDGRSRLGTVEIG